MKAATFAAAALVRRSANDEVEVEVEVEEVEDEGRVKAFACACKCSTKAVAKEVAGSGKMAMSFTCEPAEARRNSGTSGRTEGAVTGGGSEDEDENDDDEDEEDVAEEEKEGEEEAVAEEEKDCCETAIVCAVTTAVKRLAEASPNTRWLLPPLNARCTAFEDSPKRPTTYSSTTLPSPRLHQWCTG